MLFSICVDRLFSICVNILFLDMSSKLCFFPIQLLIATKIVDSVLKTVLFRGETALHKAIRNHDIKSVKLLLKLRANPNLSNFHGCTPLFAVGVIRNLEMLDLLLQYGAKPELLLRCGLFQTFDIFGQCDKRFIKKLLEYKANLMAKDKQGFTSLHYISANRKSSSFVDLLEKFNLDVNIQNSEGETPLHYAVCTEFIKFLVSKGADVNIKSHTGITPLIAAVKCERTDRENTIEILLDYGAILDNETQIIILKEAERKGEYELIQPILARIALMHSLNTLSERNREVINHNTNMASYFDICIQEIQCMRTTHITADCKATYFNILGDKEHQYITHLRNKKLTNHFNETNLALKFPIYARMITNRLRKAEDKLILVENAVNILHKNIKQLNNNFYIIRNIVMYLENHDLQLLM